MSDNIDRIVYCLKLLGFEEKQINKMTVAEAIGIIMVENEVEQIFDAEGGPRWPD